LWPISKARPQVLGNSGSFAGFIEHPEVVFDRLETSRGCATPRRARPAPRRWTAPGPECARALISLPAAKGLDSHPKRSFGAIGHDSKSCPFSDLPPAPEIDRLKR